jgi:hypothetical protein
MEQRENLCKYFKIKDLQNFGTGTDNFAYIGRIILPSPPYYSLLYIFSILFFIISVLYCSIYLCSAIHLRNRTEQIFGTHRNGDDLCFGNIR